MSKVIRTLGNEDNISFNEIICFTTATYIGLWDYESVCYFLVAKKGIEFHPVYLSTLINSLDELDAAVYEKYEEHIEEVFDCCNYKITLT